GGGGRGVPHLRRGAGAGGARRDGAHRPRRGAGGAAMSAPVDGRFDIRVSEGTAEERRLIEARRLTPPDGNFWVFGYGSLMWRPGFPYLDCRPALLRGWHRAFCI